MNLSATKEEMGRLHGQMQAVLKKAEDEKRLLTAEENEQWNKMDERMIELAAHKERLDLAATRDAKMKALDPVQLETINAGEEKAAKVKAQGVAYTGVFNRYLRVGLQGMSHEEQVTLRAGFIGDGPQAALTPATSTGGGVLIPTGFETTLTETRKWFGGIDQFSTTITTDTGNPLPFPTANDTTNMGEIVGPNTQVTQAYPSFANVILNAYKFSSKLVLVPIELLQDSYFDLNTWLATKLGQRIARIQNNKFTVGTGSSEPTGLVTAAAAAGNVFTMPTGNTASLSVDNFTDLETAVDRAYRPGSRYMLSDVTLKLVKKLKDSANRPLWQPGLSSSFAQNLEQPTVNGYGYVLNNDMPSPGASNYIMAFGDYTNFYVRRVTGYTVLRLTERYADYGQVGFLCFDRADSNLVDAGSHPIALLQNSAT